MAENSQKKLYIILGVTLALVLLALLGAATLWVLNPPDPLRDVVISPTKVRAGQDDEWQRALHPKPSGHPLEPRYRNDNISWSLEDDAGSGLKIVSVEMDYAQERYEPDYEMVHLKAPDYAWQDGDRSVRLRWVGLAELVLPENDPTASGHYQFHYYHLGEKVEPATDLSEELRRRLDMGIDYYAIPGNQIQVILEVEGFAFREYDQGPVLDKNTRISLVNHTGTSWNEDYLMFMGRKATLHKAPVIAMIDLYSGEPEVYEFEPLRNPVLKTPYFEVSYHEAHAGDFDLQYGSVGGDGKHINRDYYKYTPDPDQALMLFSLQPSGLSNKVKMEVSDGQGYEETTSLFRYTKVRWKQPASTLEAARVTYLPNATRVVVHIPALPGLERNRNVRNLLDTHIPIVKFEHERHWHWAIEQLAMMPVRQQGSYGPPPTVTYPVEFRDITLRELIELYLETHPGRTIVYDEAKDELVILPRAGPQQLWRDTKQWFKTRF